MENYFQGSGLDGMNIMQPATFEGLKVCLSIGCGGRVMAVILGDQIRDLLGSK